MKYIKKLNFIVESVLGKYLKSSLINESSSKHTKIIKRKDLKNIINECVDMCLNEVKQPKETDKSFEKWKNIFNSYLTEMISELQSDYLDRLGLTIKIKPNYIFNGGKSRWLASYERRTQQILQGVVSIGINYSLLYSEMCKRRIDKDRFNIEAQARITIGHEIGHGLVDYIKNLRLEQDILTQMPNVTIIRKCGGRKEETLVEEFGEYQFPDATECWDSILCDALEELNDINQ